MSNKEIINGIASLNSVIKSYDSIKKDVENLDTLDTVTESVIETICKENEFLMQADCAQDDNSPFVEDFGACTLTLDTNERFLNVIEQCIPSLTKNGAVSFPIKLDYSKGISMFIEEDGEDSLASAIAQNILTTVLLKKPATHFRCADIVSGGNFFTYMHKVVAELSSKSTGAVCSDYNTFDALINKLATASQNAMKAIGISYNSLYEYNASTSEKLPEYVLVLRIKNHLQHSSECINKLNTLLKNGYKTGISYIVIGDSAFAERLSIEHDIYIKIKNSNLKIGNIAEIPLTLTKNINITSQEVENIIMRLQDSDVVETQYKDLPELHTDYMSMDSGHSLRIPFAVNDNNVVQYFEIGGNAPSHALIAGSTGSGKSVLLHTLIMQTVHNYHPDDVEIWAIDYKAVEFSWYIEHSTPHFRVIAHDTSSEFSLSLVDKIFEEYESRVNKFLLSGVKDIIEYRKKMGNHSMPRILVFIDEFQILTQAVQAYTGSQDYRIQLENLFRLTRATGISFVLCSQTIASGLMGLTDAARDQIGCRLCLKHEDSNEIRETLNLSGGDASDLVHQAMNLRRGQGIYKRMRQANEPANDGKAYEFIKANILFIDDDDKKKMIEEVNALLQNNFTPKETIFVQGNARISLEEKVRHPLSQFISDKYTPSEEYIEWYPAAPVSLADSFCVNIENTGGANILVVGENDALRDSVIFHSICGFLVDSHTQVIASFIDEEHPDRARMLSQLKKLKSNRLTINIGIHDTIENIVGLKKIKPLKGKRVIYFWYGLDKLKNEIFLLNQDEEESSTTPTDSSESLTSRDAMLSDLLSTLTAATEPFGTNKSQASAETDGVTFEHCRDYLLKAFDAGPENGHHHIVVFNNNKGMKGSGVVRLEDFEHRIGTKMSLDDSYELFGTSLAINKTNESTIIYYTSSGATTPLRPYLLPSEDWVNRFNGSLDTMQIE